MDTPKHPSKSGYRLPAEWEPHEATWLSWPKRCSRSYPDPYYDPVLPSYCRLIEVLADNEWVNICVDSEEEESQVRSTLTRRGVHSKSIRFHWFPTEEPWCRDHGPVFMKKGDSSSESLCIINWEFNSWGGKYPPWEKDNQIPALVADFLDIPCASPKITLEAGAIDTNGNGVLITTESCLLHPNRNRNMTKSRMEEILNSYLGASHVIWLKSGITGDDTDGHIDEFCRFVGKSKIMLCRCENLEDRNYPILIENRNRLEQFIKSSEDNWKIVDLPMPENRYQDGIRLPCSYANFYIANGVVIVPKFNDPEDSNAAAILSESFPDREVIGIDSTALAWGLGSFHCLTQQQPIIQIT